MLTVVGDELAAQALCGRLRSEGIECAVRRTDVGAAVAAATAGFGVAGPIEVLVHHRDVRRARQIAEP